MLWHPTLNKNNASFRIYATSQPVFYNFISISDPEEIVNKKVYSMYTDPNRVTADVPGNVEGNPVFEYHDIFNPDKEEVDDLKKRYKTGNVGDVEVKKKLAKALNNYLEPIRKKRESISDEEVKRIVSEGAEKAQKVAHKTMIKVRKCLHQVID